MSQDYSDWEDIDYGTSPEASEASVCCWCSATTKPRQAPRLPDRDPPDNVPRGSHTSPSNVTHLALTPESKATARATSMLSHTRAPTKAYSTAFFTCCSCPTNSSAILAVPPAFFATLEALAHLLSSKRPARTLFSGISVTLLRNWPRSSNALPVFSSSTTT